MRIALALGGGAALGWAHAGVLRVFQREGVEIGAVAGTSIGAIAAAAVASGRVAAFEAIARTTTRTRVLGYLDPLWGRGGLLGGRRIRRELEAQFGGLVVEALPIPAAFVAADLLTGEEVAVTTGPVVDAVRASIAIPSLFAPIRCEGRMLIDGGMLSPLPLGAARALAPALPLVAIDLMGDYGGHVGAALPRGIASRASSFRVGRTAFLMMMSQLTRQAIALYRPDVVITPAIGHIGTGAFASGAELIAAGEAAAEAALQRIAALAVS